MKRDASLEEITDGKLYSNRDMVRADTNGCKGCVACCKGVGNSIVLDPYDVHRLRQSLGVDFEGLMKTGVELHVEEGLILPNLKMVGEEEACYYLNAEGRCSIHEARPGICRLFPLGRYYEGEHFHYILQVHECPKENKSKVKVKKWIATPHLESYEKFIQSWHNNVKIMQERIQRTEVAEEIRKINMKFLTTFFVEGYQEDFYKDYNERVRRITE